MLDEQAFSPSPQPSVPPAALSPALVNGYEITDAQRARSQILQTHDLKDTPHEVPEWGLTVVVRSLTGEERAQLQDAAYDVSSKRTNMRLLYAYAIIASVRVAVPDASDPEGKRLIGGDRIFTLHDRDAILKKNGEVLERLGRLAMGMSALDDASKDAAKNGSGTAQSTDFTLS